MAELFGNSRSQQLAGGKPSDVLALCWILKSAERDRSLNLLGKGAAFTLFIVVSSRARGRPRGQRFRSGGAGAELSGRAAARPDRNRWPRGSVACVRSGISGWVIGLLIRGRAGAERARRILVALVAGAGRRFPFGHSSQQSPTTKRRSALAVAVACWSLKPLLERFVGHTACASLTACSEAMSRDTSTTNGDADNPRCSRQRRQIAQFAVAFLSIGSTTLPRNERCLPKRGTALLGRRGLHPFVRSRIRSKWRRSAAQNLHRRTHRLRVGVPSLP